VNILDDMPLVVEKSRSFLFAREEKVNNRQRKELKKKRSLFLSGKKKKEIAFLSRLKKNKTTQKHHVFFWCYCS